MSHTEGNDLAGSNSEPARTHTKSAQPPHNNRLKDVFRILSTRKCNYALIVGDSPLVVSLARKDSRPTIKKHTYLVREHLEKATGGQFRRPLP